MTTPDEFSDKKVISIGAIVWVASISFSMGMIYARINDHTKDIQGTRLYTEQEVSGLRSDWDRDRIQQNERLERMETFIIKMPQ